MWDQLAGTAIRKGSGQYFEPKFDGEVLSRRVQPMVNTTQSGQCFIVEFEVLASNHPDHSPGQRVDFIQKLANLPIAMRTIKEYATATQGADPQNEQHVAQLNPHYEGIIKTAYMNPDNNAMTQRPIHLRTYSKWTKGGPGKAPTLFTVHVFSPSTGQAGERVESTKVHQAPQQTPAWPPQGVPSAPGQQGWQPPAQNPWQQPGQTQAGAWAQHPGMPSNGGSVNVAAPTMAPAFGPPAAPPAFPGFQPPAPMAPPAFPGAPGQAPPYAPPSFQPPAFPGAPGAPQPPFQPPSYGPPAGPPNFAPAFQPPGGPPNQPQPPAFGPPPGPTFPGWPPGR